MREGGEVYEVTYEIEINDKNKGFPVYSTPDRVVFTGTLVVNEKTFEWLMASHILEAREIVWRK